MPNKLDEAFSWLVVIIGIIAGALCQFPELWPLLTPWEMSIQLVKLLILPVIVLVGVWLWGYLAIEKEHQVILKSLAWIFAAITLLFDVVLIVLASYKPGPPSPEGGGPLLNTLGQIILFSPVYLAPFFYFFIIRPRMRKIYKNSKFLYSLPKQILLYIVTVILYFLANGLLINRLLGW